MEHVRLGAGLPTDIVELPEGERSKLMEQQEILFRKLADLRLERPIHWSQSATTSCWRQRRSQLPSTCAECRS